MMQQSEPSPEFGGQCAFALSTGKKGVAGKPAWSTVRDGKKYLFSNPVAKFLWHVLPSRQSKAERTWAER